MNVLVINCGSSSLKFQLINAESEEVLAKGICERIGIDGRLTYQPDPRQTAVPAGRAASLRVYLANQGSAYYRRPLHRTSTLPDHKTALPAPPAPWNWNP